MSAVAEIPLTPPASPNWLQRLSALDRAQRMRLGVGAALLVAVAIAAIVLGRQPDYRVLFANLNDKDGGAIVAQLSQMNVPYKHADGGGAILIPALIKHGYPTSYAAALQATSAELGVIIPPSIPMILYGVSAEVSIGELFIAGFGPGILISLALMAFVWAYCKYKGWGKNDGDGRLSFGKATLQAGWALLMPVIILGGIYGGVFTPTEASAVAVFYALIVGVVIYREIKIKDLFAILRKSAISSAVIMFIIANAGLFAFLITRAGVPDAIGRWLESVLQSPAMFLLGVNAALFVIGMFIETSAAIIVLAPILAPVAVHFGVDPVHFGLIMVVNLALGMITPPFGVNLFAACTVAKISLDRIVGHL
eukprot:gene45251-56356_t